MNVKTLMERIHFKRAPRKLFAFLRMSGGCLDNRRFSEQMPVPHTGTERAVHHRLRFHNPAVPIKRPRERAFRTEVPAQFIISARPCYRFRAVLADIRKKIDQMMEVMNTTILRRL